MTVQLAIHPAVYGVDLHQAVAYYRELDPSLPEQLSAEFDDRLDVIDGHPQAGRILFEDYRRVVLRQFPYLVVYAADDYKVNILAVVHGKRNPGAIRTLASIRR